MNEKMVGIIGIAGTALVAAIARIAYVAAKKRNSDVETEGDVVEELAEELSELGDE